MTEKQNYLITANEISNCEFSFSHPWNPNSQIIGSQLGKMTGLQRAGVSIVKIPPGKESFIYHSHQREEEWIYVLSGKGKADIDGKEYEVNQGDFMGFPAPGVAHNLRNPFEIELVYLVGGENLDVEIADFPNLGKRMIRYPSKIEVFDIKDDKGFGPLKED
jgi:uncharacterized cupin superfamily protein